MAKYLQGMSLSRLYRGIFYVIWRLSKALVVLKLYLKQKYIIIIYDLTILK